MTQLLLWYQPQFLMLDEPWVDKLLSVEQEVKSLYKSCSLMYLLWSQYL